MKTKLFTLLLAVAASVGTMFAESGFCGYDLTWNLTGKVLTISGTGAMFDYYSDTTPWYSYRSSITTVIINDGATSIGVYAFYGCTGLTSVTIPNSVTSIGDCAFYWCTGLTSVTIPNSVTSIGHNAFYGCSSLTSVTIPNRVTSIERSAFSRCSSLTSVTIPNGVTSIGEGAFSGCSAMTSITIPSSVTSIGVDAFGSIASGYCTALTRVNITNLSAWCNISFGNNLSNPLCFAHHLYLNGAEVKNVIIPSNKTDIGNYTFAGCSGLTSITIPSSITSIGQEALSGCSGLTSIEIPNSVTSIGSGAFLDCSGLTSIEIPNSVTSIGSGAFLDCSGLTSVTIPNSVTSIEYGTFRACSSLTSIEISKSLTSIGSRAFEGCNIHTINFIGSIEDWCNKTWSPGSVSGSYQLQFNGVLQEDIIIPNSVTSIGAWAFDGCSGLTSVTIGNSVDSIGENAFRDCTGLTSITIGNSVTSIGNDAFYNCSNLTSIIWNAKNGPSFNFGNQVTSFIFGDDVEVIPASICSGMKNLTSVTIGNSVDSIGENAFQGCSGLTSMTIGNSVTSIGDWAFYNCTGLTSVTIGNSVTSIGNNAFWGCSSLTSIIWNAKNGPSYNFGNQVTSFTFGNDVEVIPASICYGMTNLTSITIGNSVDSIGENAFRGCTSLASVMWNAKACKNFTYNNTPFYNGGSYESRFDIRSQITSFTFGDTVEKIPSYLCSRMTNLTSVKIGNSVDSIGEWAFSGCSGLTSVTIPNSVTSIGDYAFSGCTGLTSVTIPNSVTSIGVSAFYGCSSLTSVTIPNSVTSIGDDAFRNCSGLASIEIPNSVTSIGESAFYDCTGLTSVIWNVKNGPTCYFGDQVTSFTFGDDVEVIPASICLEMRNLTSVTIPNSVTSIGGDAFRGCTGLTSVTIPNSVTSIGSYAFYNCTGLTSVTIPNSVTSIGSWAFSGCSGLTSVTIPNSVTSIGSAAFAGCSGLTSVTIESENPPTLIWGVFYGTNDYPLYVPCGSVDVYKTAWTDYANRIMQNPSSCFTITTSSANLEWGTTTGDTNASYLTEVAISAMPKFGYHFVQWADGGTDNPRTIVLTQDTTFEAIFAPNKYSIKVSCDDKYGHIDGEDGYYEYLTEHTYTAVPNYGYHFDHWKDTTFFDITNALTVTEAYTLASQLEANQISSEMYHIHGYVVRAYGTNSNSYYLADTPDGSTDFVVYRANNSAQIGDHVHIYGYLKNYNGTTPETSYGALLQILSGDQNEIPNETNRSNPRTVTLESDMHIYAEFAKNIYTITGETNGMGEITGIGNFEYLTECTISANPIYGYHFVQWADGNTDNPRTIILTQDTTFTAEFARNLYSVQFFGFNQELLSSQEVEYGTAAVAPEAPIVDHYDFVGWDKDFTNVTGDLDVYAIYQKNTEDVENVDINGLPVKVLHDGQIFILRGEKVYTLTGQEVK